jgi:hypothetical protein
MKSSAHKKMIKLLESARPGDGIKNNLKPLILPDSSRKQKKITSNYKKSISTILQSGDEDETQFTMLPQIHQRATNESPAS